MKLIIGKKIFYTSCQHAICKKLLIRNCNLFGFQTCYKISSESHRMGSKDSRSEAWVVETMKNPKIPPRTLSHFVTRHFLTRKERQGISPTFSIFKQIYARVFLLGKSREIIFCVFFLTWEDKKFPSCSNFFRLQFRLQRDKTPCTTLMKTLLVKSYKVTNYFHFHCINVLLFTPGRPHDWELKGED